MPFTDAYKTGIKRALEKLSNDAWLVVCQDAQEVLRVEPKFEYWTAGMGTSFFKVDSKQWEAVSSDDPNDYARFSNRTQKAIQKFDESLQWWQDTFGNGSPAGADVTREKIETR